MDHIWWHQNASPVGSVLSQMSWSSYHPVGHAWKLGESFHLLEVLLALDPKGLKLKAKVSFKEDEGDED